MPKLPTIDIKGREYTLVKDRISYFNTKYPSGSITTDLLSAPESKQILIKATVTPDIAKPERKFTGYSQAVVGQGMVNTTAALENCETSAVGRALGMMGIGILDSVASADEMKKAEHPDTPTMPVPPEQKPSKEIKNPSASATEKQIQMIFSLAKQKGKVLTPAETEHIKKYNKKQASVKIDELLRVKVGFSSGNPADLNKEARKIFKPEEDEIEIVEEGVKPEEMIDTSDIPL